MGAQYDAPAAGGTWPQKQSFDARRGQELTLAGQPMAFLVTGEDTKHTSMFEWTVPAGFSTGLHVHRVQEETFYVLDGECEWQVGDRLVRAGPGAYLFLPPGVPHNIPTLAASRCACS